ncbi:Mitochondrial import inner membrane translocase subunit TIM10 [Camellia lanceoleosa]|uniref:Mitochondrial import inner membrane translocase subunit TIM10 n=1 Tax=Camellia lanceoleosa TaxID=1840588 RepID=A0ACC0F5Z2_9ERIC|nr:Mitochondrial import inner membrane translocase subunit TIM10 [Camellia lanceoleosa]
MTDEPGQTRYNSFSTLVLNPQRILINMAAKNNIPTPVDREQIFGMAEKEMEYRVELFNKLTHTCFNKCVEKRYKEAELNMGENSCIDRCVSKYWQVTNLIGQLLGSNRPPM